MRAVSLRGVTAWELTERVLPGELVGDRLPRELAQQCCDQHQHGHESDQLWLPLQHPANTSQKTPDGGILSCSRARTNPPIGGFGLNTAQEAETRPASASGLRAQAKRFWYQPESVVTATP